MVTSAHLPLSGVRVIDFTRFVSGSYASLLLAVMGAEVLKVEMPPNGDPYRSQGAVKVGGESVLFMTLNSGKKSIAIDFRAPETRPIFDALLASADVLVENGRPGSLAGYGLDFTSVSERHPHIVYGSISGYGHVGPQAGQGGFDLILQAESGLMSVTGHPSTGPAKIGAPVTDVGAGISCLAGITAALYDRTRTGRGRHVTTSLLEFALASLSTLAADCLVTHEVPGLLGTHSPSFAPYGLFRSSDGWVALAGAGSDEMWAKMCSALGLEHLAADSRFVDNGSRVRHRDELTDEIEAHTSHRSSQSLIADLQACGVPSSRVSDLGEALSSDQTRALEMLRPVDTSEGEAIATVSSPVGFDTVDRAAPTIAPRLGQHTAEVVSELGLTRAEIERLVDEGLALT